MMKLQLQLNVVLWRRYAMRPRKFLWAVIVALVALGSGHAEAGLLGLEATGHLARPPRWAGLPLARTRRTRSAPSSQDLFEYDLQVHYI